VLALQADVVGPPVQHHDRRMRPGYFGLEQIADDFGVAVGARKKHRFGFGHDR
jgi:hypothetical protein